MQRNIILFLTFILLTVVGCGPDPVPVQIPIPPMENDYNEFVDTERIMRLTDVNTGYASLEFKMIRREYINRTFGDNDPRYEVYLVVKALQDFSGELSYLIENYSDLSVHIYTYSNVINDLQAGQSVDEGIISNDGILLKFCTFSIVASIGTDTCTYLDPNFSDSAPADPSGQVSKVGCYVDSLDSNSGFGNIGISFYDSYHDQRFAEEVAQLKSFFSNIPADVYVLYEHSADHRNAYATSSGQIYFGYHMFYSTIVSYGDLAVIGVLAHEWGHRIQFTLFGQQSNPFGELEADAFAGYYMGLAKLWGWSRVQGYFNNVYASGDYNFNDINHHGTGDQRLASAYLGVSVALNAIENNILYTYDQLHHIFNNEINNNILGTSIYTLQSDLGKTSYPIEDSLQSKLKIILAGYPNNVHLTFPKGLKPNDVKHLWPCVNNHVKPVEQ